MVPRRFTTHLGSSSSPKSTPKNSPKLTSQKTAPLLGAESSTSLEDDASPKVPRKEDKSSVSDQKVEDAPDQKVQERRWSVSDLPSLKLHNQNLPTLVGMLEQVSCSSRNSYKFSMYIN